MISRQRKYQIRNQSEGRCVQCGKDRGDSVNKKYCNECRIKNNILQKKSREVYKGDIKE